MTYGQRNFLTTLEIPSRDPSFSWVLQWVSHHARDTQHLSVQTVYRQYETGRRATQFELVPSPGLEDLFMKFVIETALQGGIGLNLREDIL